MVFLGKKRTFEFLLLPSSFPYLWLENSSSHKEVKYVAFYNPVRLITFNFVRSKYIGANSFRDENNNFYHCVIIVYFIIVFIFQSSYMVKIGLVCGYYSPLGGMEYHLYPWVERGTVRVKLSCPTENAT